MAFEDKKIDDIYALQVLSPLLNGVPYVALTGGSARPLLLANALDDVVLNRRRRILEFGAGISTILIGRLLKVNGLDAEVLSVEHDRAWANACARAALFTEPRAYSTDPPALTK